MTHIYALDLHICTLTRKPVAPRAHVTLAVRKAPHLTRRITCLLPPPPPPLAKPNFFQINISAPIRESLHGAIFSMLPISANIFQAAEDHVRPLLEDSFRRYKKNQKGYGTCWGGGGGSEGGEKGRRGKGENRGKKGAHHTTQFSKRKKLTLVFPLFLPSFIFFFPLFRYHNMGKTRAGRNYPTSHGWPHRSTAQR